MIGLTERQGDALKELVNIAFGLTASKLSEISSRRIVLEVPVVAIHPMVDLASEWESLLQVRWPPCIRFSVDGFRRCHFVIESPGRTNTQQSPC
jgi:hypothetical protein